MTLIVYTLLFTGVIFFIYGVYLFTLINKDISKYKLPTFVINNVKPVCYSSIIIGISLIFYNPSVMSSTIGKRPCT